MMKQTGTILGGTLIIAFCGVSLIFLFVFKMPTYNLLWQVGYGLCILAAVGFGFFIFSKIKGKK